MIHGEPGTGKSLVTHALAEKLERLTDPIVVSKNHPQSNLAHFYREIGGIFGLGLRPHNRWSGFRTLRKRWMSHLQSTRRHPILFIDEAQEMRPPRAQRTTSHAQLPLRFAAPAVCGLGGDTRLTDKLRRDELLPMGSRIRSRLGTAKASAEDLLAHLDHLFASASPRS
ncbi:ATP-binding protein [Paraburkholderia phenoliruptrix]|uniref:ATP-binding protein n=1 Tax=Paraburkholderia phenoliruptrix TaxID=252970 RepID=UPI002869E346|nr:ATP-binding protein [Paraburkholderia phenoliruptrix]WMY11042.1 ATP-binding protein [Paraburkholderia phenoliruptrix]